MTDKLLALVKKTGTPEGVRLTQSARMGWVVKFSLKGVEYTPWFASLGEAIYFMESLNNAAAISIS